MSIPPHPPSYYVPRHIWGLGMHRRTTFPVCRLTMQSQCWLHVKEESSGEVFPGAGAEVIQPWEPGKQWCLPLHIYSLLSFLCAVLGNQTRASSVLGKLHPQSSMYISSDSLFLFKCMFTYNYVNRSRCFITRYFDFVMYHGLLFLAVVYDDLS